MENNTPLARIKNDGILPLFYHDDPKTCIGVCRALHKSGIAAVEFTNRGANAVNNFKALVAERDASMPGLLLGIGTVATAEQAMTFISSGADFLVSPFFDEGVSRVAADAGIAWIPGCMTPREVHMAREAGWGMVKLFPGNVLGTGFVEAIRPLFRDMDFVVTGGVEAEEANIAAWFKSGVSAVGMGSKLITPEMLANVEFGALTAAASEIVSLIKRLK